MGKARSDDLRERVVAAVAAGASRHQAAARFQVGVSSAIRWVALQAETGSIKQRSRGGKSRSPLEAHADWLLALNVAENDLTLVQIEQRLRDERGVKTTEASLRRFFRRHRITVKKNTARQRADAARRGRSARLVEGEPAEP
jgi:transposase